MSKRMSNRGSTLIEVIVCVLIIGIAFVPLLAGLTASMRVNRETENRLFAENVASNLVEICKTYGQQGLDKLKDINNDTNNGIKAFLAGDNVELIKLDDENFKIKKISSGSEGKYYWANIKFSDDNYVTVDETTGERKKINQNDFEAYPSISSLTNAVVVSFSKPDFNTILTNMFYYVDATHKNPNVDEDDLKSTVSSWLKRQITVDIKDNTIEGKTRYSVDSKIEYIVDGSAIAGTENIFEGSISRVVYETEPYERVTVYYTGGTYDEHPIGTNPEPTTYGTVPQSIIVTYVNLKDTSGNYVNISAPNFSPYVNHDMIINKYVEGVVNVYAMCSDVSTVKGLGHYLTMDAFEYSGTYTDPQVGTYSNLTPLDVDGDPLGGYYFGEYYPIAKFGVGSSGKQSKMKDVTVTVWEYDGDDEGSKVVEKDSTVIEFE